MQISEGEKLIAGFIAKCESDSDPYLIVHFSREDDHYQGYNQGMDILDAMIVIKELKKQFNLPVKHWNNEDA